MRKKLIRFSARFLFLTLTTQIRLERLFNFVCTKGIRAPLLPFRLVTLLVIPQVRFKSRFWLQCHFFITNFLHQLRLLNWRIGCLVSRIVVVLVNWLSTFLATTYILAHWILKVSNDCGQGFHLNVTCILVRRSAILIFTCRFYPKDNSFVKHFISLWYFVTFTLTVLFFYFQNTMNTSTQIIP